MREAEWVKKARSSQLLLQDGGLSPHSIVALFV